MEQDESNLHTAETTSLQPKHLKLLPMNITNEQEQMLQLNKIIKNIQQHLKKTAMK